MNFLAKRKNNPWQDLDSLHEVMHQFFGLPARPWQWGGLPFGEETFVPPVDIRETATELIVKADLPGIAKEEISVVVEDDVLSISGEKNHSTEVKKNDYVRTERYTGLFKRSFVLPSKVEVSKVKAHYADGVLEIVLPKKADACPKQIKVDIA